jgi:tRNA threonylcarbamoyladenosine biosynthesis protein TsaE
MRSPRATIRAASVANVGADLAALARRVSAAEFTPTVAAFLLLAGRFDMQAIVESSTYLADEAATLAFAAKFAATLAAPCSIALIGDLGAGKTTFVRGVLRALGVTGAIKSPTYALVESYETAEGEVHHLDAYRIESSDDFEARGGFEYFDVPSIRFVEWPQRLDGAVNFDLTIRFDFEDDGRRATVRKGFTP